MDKNNDDKLNIKNYVLFIFAPLQLKQVKMNKRVITAEIEKRKQQSFLCYSTHDIVEVRS